MPKILKLEGQKICEITFIKRSNTKKGHHWYWEAQCSCGTFLKVLPHTVKPGRLTSCGCKKYQQFKDHTGKKVNKLTFIEPIRSVGVRLKWKVQCECGNFSEVLPYAVLSGKIKGCLQCGKHSTAKDWTGLNHGKLTFIKQRGTYSSGQMIWESHCECGNICFTVPSSNAQSCGCIGIQKSKNWCSILGSKGRKFSPEISCARRVWSGNYKDGDIDFEQFYNLSQKPCFYCGTLFSNENFTEGKIPGSFKYNGLDRIDSSKLHTQNNVVTCCKWCNLSKRERSVADFLNHIKMIYHHQKL